MESFFSPIGLLLVLVGLVAILFGTRRQALGALILLGLFIPMANRIEINDVDLNAHRLLVLAGLLRLRIRHEAEPFTFNTISRR